MRRRNTCKTTRNNIRIDSHFLFNRPKPQLHTPTPSSLSNRLRDSGGEQKRDGGEWMPCMMVRSIAGWSRWTHQPFSQLLNWKCVEDAIPPHPRSWHGVRAAKPNIPLFSTNAELNAVRVDANFMVDPQQGALRKQQHKRLFGQFPDFRRDPFGNGN
jgi:hypothetical protein